MIRVANKALLQQDFGQSGRLIPGPNPMQDQPGWKHGAGPMVWLQPLRIEDGEGLQFRPEENFTEGQSRRGPAPSSGWRLQIRTCSEVFWVIACDPSPLSPNLRWKLLHTKACGTSTSGNRAREGSSQVLGVAKAAEARGRCWRGKQ